MSFSKKIKELRFERGVTQAELAEGIGFSQGRVSAWERKEHEPTVLAIIKISGFFGVTSDFLLGLEDEGGTKIKNVDSFCK